MLTEADKKQDELFNVLYSSLLGSINHANIDREGREASPLHSTLGHAEEVCNKREHWASCDATVLVWNQQSHLL